MRRRWFGLALTCSLLMTTAAISAAEGWSKPQADLKGRLVAASREIDGRQVIELWVELHNAGSIAKKVITHDPFAFELTVRDAEGEVIESAAQRLDILSSPQTAIVPRNCALRLPVTLAQEKHWNLDITTHLWQLKPRRYTLSGKYLQVSDGKPLPLDGSPQPWTGELPLPEITIEVK